MHVCMCYVLCTVVIIDQCIELRTLVVFEEVQACTCQRWGIALPYPTPHKN